MESKRMKPHEALQEYFLATRNLAHEGCLDTESLIEYAINGISDSSNSKIILYGCKSIPEFKEKLKLFEKLFCASGNVRQNIERKFDPGRKAKFEQKRTPNPLKPRNSQPNPQLPIPDRIEAEELEKEIKCLKKLSHSLKEENKELKQETETMDNKVVELEMKIDKKKSQTAKDIPLMVLSEELTIKDREI
ncbi:uncharacterized protein TNIN_201621 [Trichonephila inaurata madagascariensis]|uniref:Uncharacterized protein n=1 Tax=Trichonephila inaurata madagascariensis TaxID=2747483 RepID=A0A8X6YYW2_9ARAC|nr:uncharacterized protein TNIN_201621 [Trichonephila inaurata madagascariensis]